MVSVGLQMTSDCRAQVAPGCPNLDSDVGSSWLGSCWVRMKSARTLIGARMTSLCSRTWSLRRTLKAFGRWEDDVG